MLLGTIFTVAGPASTSWAGFSAQEVDSADSFSAGTLQIEATTSSTCFSTGTGSGGTVSSNVASCPGSPLPSGQLTVGSVAAASSNIVNVGSVSPQTTDITLLSCGAAEVADSSGDADTGLVYGSVSFGTTFTSPVNPGFTSAGISLTGATGTYVGTVSSVLAPSSFTLVAWIKTTTTSGGGILGFATDQPDRVGTAADRMLWVEPSGQVAFGVLSNRSVMEELTSTGTVNNGNWHFVAATFNGSSMSIDIDGTVTSTSATIASSYTGYWHIGWTGDSTWPSSGTDEYLAGSVFGAGVFPTLTTTNLGTLEDAASATAYEADAAELSPSGLWLLSDSGTVAYTGTVPVLGSTPLCKDVLIDVQATVETTTTCIFPVGSGPCPATPPATATLNSLGTEAIPWVSTSSPVTIATRMTLALASAPGVVGLHLLAGVAFTGSTTDWTAQLAYPAPTLEM